jgi:predicted mannosyl-3-phosphoglycerate phosphatase (HAD superfamily)
MIRWEYSTVVVEGGDIQSSVPWLDQAGNDGWEVIHVQSVPYGMVYLVKKPLPIEGAQPDPTIKHNHSVTDACWVSCPHRGTINEIV